jgi:hypothetical protein
MKRRIISLLTVTFMAFTLVVTALATYSEPGGWEDPPMEVGPDGEYYPTTGQMPIGEFGATEQAVVPEQTPARLDLDALMAIANVGARTTVEPVTFGDITLTINPTFAGSAEVQAAQATLHNLVASGHLPDGAALLGAIWFYGARDEDGVRVEVDEEITITLNMPGVQYGGSYHALYFNSSTGVWVPLYVTVTANGVVTVTLPNIGSLLGIIRVVAGPAPDVLGEVSAPATYH